MKKTEQKTIVRRVFCAGRKSYIANGIMFSLCVIGFLVMLAAIIYRRFGHDLLFIAGGVIFAIIAVWISLGDAMSFVCLTDDDLCLKNFYGKTKRSIAIGSIKSAEIVRVKGASEKEFYFILCAEDVSFGPIASPTEVLRNKNIIYYRVTMDTVDFTDTFYFGKIKDEGNYLISNESME